MAEGRKPVKKWVRNPLRKGFDRSDLGNRAPRSKSFQSKLSGKGIEVTIPDKSNKANERVQETQQVTGLTQPTGARAIKFKLEADKEIYFEEGELLVPPTFEDTKLDKKRIKSAPDKSSDARRKR